MKHLPDWAAALVFLVAAFGTIAFLMVAATALPLYIKAVLSTIRKVGRGRG